MLITRRHPKIMKKWKKFLPILLAITMITPLTPLPVNPTQFITVQAKTTAKHTVFAEKQVERRIKKMQDYYYNKKDQLKIRKQKISLPSGEDCSVSYYIHGKDLMFGYGVSGKTEYRMYFYKNQLVRILVDAPGKERKTYKQLYTELTETFYDETVNLYMMLENFARKQMEYALPKTKKIIKDRPVLVTKVSGKYILYHKLYCYGSDGAMWSIDKKVYKAKISSKTIVLDGSNNPTEPTKRNLKWLKKCVNGKYIGYAVWLKGSGNVVSKIDGIYCA